jgi:hypothetical protein
MKNERLTFKGMSSALGVKPKSVYDWLRGKGPVRPNHVRAQLFQEINESRRRETKSREKLIRHERHSVQVLLDLFLFEGVAHRVAHLPAEYRERYRGRVKDITVGLEES